MKSGEDFRRAMGPADDGFVRVIAQALRMMDEGRRGTTRVCGRETLEPKVPLPRQPRKAIPIE